MNFNPAQHAGLFAALLLVPGMLFMFVLVAYLAFVGRDSADRRQTARACLKCGRTLPPEQGECPDCVAQVNPPAANDPEPVQIEERGTASPPDSSLAYEGELVEEPEPVDDQPAREHD